MPPGRLKIKVFITPSLIKRCGFRIFQKLESQVVKPAKGFLFKGFIFPALLFGFKNGPVVSGVSDFHQASAIHLQAATVSGVQIAAAMASSKPNMGRLVSEPTLFVSAGKHLPHPSDCSARFQGFASPIW